MINTLIDLCVDLVGAIGVVLAQGRQILAQRRANFGRLVLVGPFARDLRARLFCNGSEFVQRILIVVKSNRKVAECKRVVIANAALPVGGHRADLVGIFDQGVCVFRSLGLVGRHIDAARIHHRGINQPVDTFDIPAAGIGGFEFFSEGGVLARVRHRNDRQRHSRGSHQCEDHIEPDGDRKLGQVHQGAPRPYNDGSEAL
jgi:hypothetical protein